MIAIIVVVGFSSCEYFYDYTFEVRNTSSDTIAVTVRQMGGSETILIRGEESVIVHTEQGGPEGCCKPSDKDMLRVFDGFEVRRSDAEVSKRDYLSSDAWFFNDGVYRAYVTDAEFQ